jgi:predicted DNA-binding WGR domain protein
MASFISSDATVYDAALLSNTSGGSNKFYYVAIYTVRPGSYRLFRQWGLNPFEPGRGQSILQGYQSYSEAKHAFDAIIHAKRGKGYTHALIPVKGYCGSTGSHASIALPGEKVFGF